MDVIARSIDQLFSFLCKGGLGRVDNDLPPLTPPYKGGVVIGIKVETGQNKVESANCRKCPVEVSLM